MGYGHLNSTSDFSQDLEDGTHLYGWKSSPPLTPFAPDYVHYFTEKKIFSDEECEEWKVYLLKQEKILLDKYRTSMGDGATGLGSTSVTSRYAHYNMLELDFHLIEQFKTEISKGICCHLEVSDNTTWQETLHASCWFNVLRKGEGMDPHAHTYGSHTFLGFHLCISANESFTSYYHPIKYQEEAFYIPNKIGTLTIFPNFIPHSVSLNRYEIPRVSIAGDIYASTFLDIQDPNALNNHLVEIGTYNGNNELLQEAK